MTDWSAYPSVAAAPDQWSGYAPVAPAERAQPTSGMMAPIFQYALPAMLRIGALPSDSGAFLEQAGRTATGGLQDKMAAGITSLATGSPYHAELQKQRDIGNAYAEQNPNANIAATGMGIAAPMVFAPGATLPQLATRGAALGGLSAFGKTNDQSLVGDLSQTAIGAGLGAMAAPVAGALAPSVAKLGGSHALSAPAILAAIMEHGNPSHAAIILGSVLAANMLSRVPPSIWQRLAMPAAAQAGRFGSTFAPQAVGLLGQSGDGAGQ